MSYIHSNLCTSSVRSDSEDVSKAESRKLLTDVSGKRKYKNLGAKEVMSVALSTQILPKTDVAQIFWQGVVVHSYTPWSEPVGTATRVLPEVRELVLDLQWPCTEVKAGTFLLPAYLLGGFTWRWTLPKRNPRSAGCEQLAKLFLLKLDFIVQVFFIRSEFMLEI